MLDVFIAIRFPTLATSTQELAITHPCPTNLINYNSKKIVKSEISKSKHKTRPKKRKKYAKEKVKSSKKFSKTFNDNRSKSFSKIYFQGIVQ